MNPCPLILALALAGATTTASGRQIDLSNAGLIPDGKTANTGRLQAALDELGRAGGGELVVPTGTFLTGPLWLRSGVHLRLESGAVLLGSPSLADYRGAEGLINVVGCHDVTLEGPGLIRGNGEHFVTVNSDPNRPKLINLSRSDHLAVRNLELRDSATWTLVLNHVSWVTLAGVRIYSQCNWNNDGIDVDGSNITISDCIVDGGDDALCLKSSGPEFCENIAVTNCVLASNSNLIKLGTGSKAGFRNISISNCSLRAPTEDRFYRWQEPRHHFPGVAKAITGISGIALECVDGGILDQVAVSNITMRDVQTAIFIQLGQRSGPKGVLRRVVICNVLATTESLATSSITGVPGNRVEDVTLRDILIDGVGGGTIQDARRVVPERDVGYPENRMYGPSLPAYGLYVRHAQGIVLENVRFRLRHPDARPDVIMEDVLP